MSMAKKKKNRMCQSSQRSRTDQLNSTAMQRDPSFRIAFDSMRDAGFKLHGYSLPHNIYDESAEGPK